MTINDSAISEQGMCEEEQVARIAWFYYHDGLTQSEISDRLGLTRLKVSRLLEKGHQSGSRTWRSLWRNGRYVGKNRW
ncbi:hypothetical protein E9R01_RS17575 [Escherichia coli]|nr:hypothetical protein [Escherichia coli]